MDPSNDPTWSASEAGYCRPDYVRAFGSWTEVLTDGDHAELSIRADGNEVPLASEYVWTGFRTYDDQASYVNCGDWTDPGQTGVVGNHHSTAGDGWRNAAVPANQCTKKRRLYCFEQPPG